MHSKGDPYDLPSRRRLAVAEGWLRRGFSLSEGDRKETRRMLLFLSVSAACTAAAAAAVVAAAVFPARRPLGVEAVAATRETSRARRAARTPQCSVTPPFLCSSSNSSSSNSSSNDSSEYGRGRQRKVKADGDGEQQMKAQQRAKQRP